MRVLMLGWEFPPHISGGLGTACLGISKGLSQSGVDVTFVVPRLFGDEDSGAVELLSASEVPVPEPNAPRVPVRMRHAYSGVRDGGRSPEREPSPGMKWHPVDSLLRPYMREIDYVRRLEELRHEARRRDREEREARHRSRLETSAAATAVAPPRTRALEGGYGPNLAAEVERYAEVVAELARTEEFDVVHAHDWMTYPAGIAAARVSKKPLVVHVHACEFDRSGADADPIIRSVEQRGLEAADRVVCVSEYTAGVVRDNYRVDASKLRVVHNAVTRKEQQEQLRVEKTVKEPIVLFLGRITYQKGPDYFLEAAARVLKVLPDVRFVLSGSGDMWPKMIERAARLGIAANTHFTGFLEGPEVERMFAMADLYVMPSVSEPFGISPLEAMALDVPVIISRQSGVSEVLTNALKVDFWDVEDLANKILALLRYPALTSELSASGRREIERMSWEERGRALRRVYEELAA